jgi:hypothetical protein
MFRVVPLRNIAQKFIVAENFPGRIYVLSHLGKFLLFASAYLCFSILALFAEMCGHAPSYF